eukprot:COSAG01_NODE_3693_length_5788_cov_7.398137_3_plen_167_part_00
MARTRRRPLCELLTIATRGVGSSYHSGRIEQQQSRRTSTCSARAQKRQCAGMVACRLHCYLLMMLGPPLSAPPPRSLGRGVRRAAVPPLASAARLLTRSNDPRASWLTADSGYRCEDPAAAGTLGVGGVRLGLLRGCGAACTLHACAAGMAAAGSQRAAGSVSVCY